MPYLVWRVIEKRFDPATGDVPTISVVDHRTEAQALDDARKRALAIRVWVDEATGEAQEPPQVSHSMWGHVVYAEEWHAFTVCKAKAAQPAPFRA